MWLLGKFLRRLIRNGRLRVIDHDGSRHEFGDGTGDPVVIRLTDSKAAFHIARDPRVGAGEAFMDGRLVVEDPHDIRDLILLIGENAAAQGGEGSLSAPGLLRRAVDAVEARMDQRNLRGKARRNAEHHYNLTREFYELFLDADRQYTMAYWRDLDGSLEQAQRDKKCLIAAKLGDVEPGMRILDIGCGWGGMALTLNRLFGCEVLGVSLASEQIAYCRERAEAAGVADKVRFETMDYRDVDGVFDRITSVGMIEAIGRPHFDEYFGKTRDLLTDDGIMLTHTIGRTGPPGLTDKWTRRYIFPGGYIPSLSELVAAMERQRWEIADVEYLRYHYAHTLAQWYERAVRQRDKIVALFDERFYRMWLFYLAGAEQSFRHGSMVNFHIQSVRRRSAVPMTRDTIQTRFEELVGREEAPAPP